MKSTLMAGVSLTTTLKWGSRGCESILGSIATTPKLSGRDLRNLQRRRRFNARHSAQRWRIRDELAEKYLVQARDKKVLSGASK